MHISNTLMNKMQEKKTLYLSCHCSGMNSKWIRSHLSLWHISTLYWQLLCRRWLHHPKTLILYEWTQWLYICKNFFDLYFFCYVQKPWWISYILTNLRKNISRIIKHKQKHRILTFTSKSNFLSISYDLDFFSDLRFNSGRLKMW